MLLYFFNKWECTRDIVKYHRLLKTVKFFFNSSLGIDVKISVTNLSQSLSLYLISKSLYIRKVFFSFSIPEFTLLCVFIHYNTIEIEQCYNTFLTYHSSS